MFNRQEQALAARIAARNIGLYKIKSLTIGALICFGTFLIVFGLNLLRNVERSMQDSIISSVAGHIQVYAKGAKDSLALFGGSFMGREDIGTLPRFEEVAQIIEQNPQVQAVVPMGFDMAFLGRGNELDEVFDALRLAIKQQDKNGIEEAIAHAKHQISIAEAEIEQLVKVSSNLDELREQQRLIEATNDPAFWKDLTSDPERVLQYLETKIAPISGEKQPIYLRYLGTDIPKFIENFKKFSIKEGTVVPANTRGIMVSHKFREDYLKNIPARYFDKLYKAKTISRTKLTDDAETKLWLSDLARQYMAILVHLDSQESAAVKQQLATYLKSDGTLEELVMQFLRVDDESIESRYTFFYQTIAPKIKLYEINIGDSLVMRSYTRSGFIKTLPIKVYGVYGFAGLEDSDLAGGFNIIDLVSFRELYGEMDESGKKELAELREQAQIKEVSSENIEDALFGDAAQIESTRSAQTTARTVTQAPTLIDAAAARSNEFLPNEVTSGLALNLAVVLKDGSAAGLEKVQDELTKEFEKQKMDVKAVDWQEASGFVGQFVGIVRIVLVIGVLIIFLVALVIINNTLVVATLDRSREIGTMRAIGAQKSFILSLFLWETFGIASVGVLAGTFLAGSALFYSGLKGIPAGHDVVVFLFSGLRLYPKIELSLLFILPCLVTLLAVLSSLYSARFAARVTPVTAMQEKE